MNNRENILAEFRRVPENTLVMAGKMYREWFSEQMSEAAFAQAISRLCKSGEIQRISKGIYCRPKRTRFGMVPPSEQEIVEQFTAEDNGVVIGYALYNALGVTTQVSKRIEAYSSITDEQLKQIGNVTIRKADLEYHVSMKDVIRLMELLHHYRDFQDINYSALLRSTERLAKSYKEETFLETQKEIGYPKWTIAFLKEVLDHYHIPNTLDRHLSALSSYRIPRMEELYEAAQRSS